MTVKHTLIALTAVTTLALSVDTNAAVNGRFMRVEAPASSRMVVHEVEIWSGGANLVLKNKTLTFAGTGYRGSDLKLSNKTRMLNDGQADLNQRGVDFETAQGVNPWMEVDLGSQRSIDRIVLTQPVKPVYDDRALRLVSVLDASRRVVFVAAFDIRREPYHEGVATLALEPGTGPLVGRIVPENTAQWAPLGDILEARQLPPPPDAKARDEAFARRNFPAAIEQLAGRFCTRLDLSRPELQGVRERFDRRDFAGALDAYRDHFLGKLQGIVFLHEHPLGQATYDTAADDLLRNVAVVFARFDVEAQRFAPGRINWGHAPEGDDGALDTARVRARAGLFQRPLLTAYRETGRPALLAQWSAITDDWGMNIRADLGRAKQDLRFYFVKDVLQEFNHLADELVQTARKQPDFARRLSGATLARLLIPVVEEYPPAYWWPCRRATFNHTYNALDAATVTARILDDFHAGQRLDRENRQHWERVWDMMVTRDGSMNEIGDEGHMFMQWRMGVLFNQMKKTPPPWFTPDFAAEFETGWIQTTTYPIRHLAPDGRGHRTGVGELFDQIWELSGRTCTYGGMIPRETVDSTKVIRHPEVAGILQSVFGAGRDRDGLTPHRQQIYDKVTAYYGKTFTPPTTVSEWMPYAGLHYLRRSWEPDATFVAMICQPKDHPSTNGSEWNTSFQVWDYGQPLVACGPVTVDGQPQFAAAGTQTYWPGSKTVQLATASERPIPARWHTSPRFDYAEAFYEGTYQAHGYNYQEHRLDLGKVRLDGVRAERRIILVRPARLVIVTDAVRVPSSSHARHYELEERFGSPEVGKRGVEPTGAVDGDARNVALTHDNAPGVTVRRFTDAQLTWDKGRQPSWNDRGGMLRAQTDGDLLMCRLIEPHRRTGDARVKTTRSLTAKGVAGFTATLADGATLTWLATRGDARRLKAGPVELVGEGLLLDEREEETSGLVLGGKSLSFGGKDIQLPAADFEFTLRNGQLTDTTSIRRPIEPVTFSPRETVFTNSVKVTLSSATPGVEIRCTFDGTEPEVASPLYTEPLTITENAFLRARAFRRGVKEIPFTAAGTDATVISNARYSKRGLRPSLAVPAVESSHGVNWELVEADWFALFSHLHLRDVLPAKSGGHTEKLLDVSMRAGDGPFGVRYEGFLDIPTDGVWTFHAPEEYVGASCEPGYDLRLWIDGEEWCLGQRFHGRGLWSVPLAKGLHRLLVTFADARRRDRTVPDSGLWRGYPTPWVVWKGESPVIEVSGPGVSRQPIPSHWLRRQSTP